MHCCDVCSVNSDDGDASCRCVFAEGAPDPAILFLHGDGNPGYARALSPRSSGKYETGQFAPPRQPVVSKRPGALATGITARAAGRDAVRTTIPFANPRSRFKPMYHLPNGGIVPENPRAR